MGRKCFDSIDAFGEEIINHRTIAERISEFFLRNTMQIFRIKNSRLAVLKLIELIKKDHL